MADYPIGVTVEEGLDMLLAQCQMTQTERVAIEQARGRILAEDIVSKEDMPPFARSPYDGYAFRSVDVAEATKERPVTLLVIEEVAAGHAPTVKVEAGQAVKILTGAPIPEGANVVEKYEKTTFDEELVQIYEPYEPGTNIVPAGEDVTKGTSILKAGEKITPPAIGLLAGLGIGYISVYAKVKTAIISTGDELTDVWRVLKPGKIRNSSAYTIQSYLDEWGADAHIFGIIPDDVEMIAHAIETASLEADLVITTGGVSVGDYDCIGRAMQEAGADILYQKMKMKPGSAFLAAHLHETPVLCLSGNPSAALLALMMVGKPLVRRMMGEKTYENPVCSVTLCEDFPKESKNRRFVPGKFVEQDGKFCFKASIRQGNGKISPLLGCNAIGEIPAGSPSLKAGSVIRAYQI
jgi:molybdopterin molybdotransferase